jgi:hypothetical protein
MQSTEYARRGDSKHAVATASMQWRQHEYSGDNMHASRRVCEQMPLHACRGAGARAESTAEMYGLLLPCNGNYIDATLRVQTIWSLQRCSPDITDEAQHSKMFLEVLRYSDSCFRVRHQVDSRFPEHKHKTTLIAYITVTTPAALQKYFLAHNSLGY